MLNKNRTVWINRELTSMYHEVMENLESIHGALLRMNRSIQTEGTFGIMKNDGCYNQIVRRGIKIRPTRGFPRFYRAESV